MGDDPGHTRADLTALALAAPGMDFFELVRQLETAELRFGRAGNASNEPARLGQSPRLSFAAGDVVGLTPGDIEHPTQVQENVIGLIGPEGPMPLHMTRWIMMRMSNRWFAGDSEGATSDTAFLDFINMLQHRIISLYWRAWADARAEVHVAHGDGGRVTALMRALAGLGLPGTVTGDQRLDGAKLHHATSLALEARSPERLCGFLETVLNVPVNLEEFVGLWVEIPIKLQTRIGMTHAGLGTAAVAGDRFFDRAGHAEIRLGPLSFRQFSTFLTDVDAWGRLRHAVLFVGGRETAYSVRLVLATGQVPAAQLGTAQLGRTAWLAPDDSKGAEDLVFSNMADRDPPAQNSRRAA